MKKSKDILIIIFLVLVISVLIYLVSMSFHVQKEYREIPIEKNEVVKTPKLDVNSSLVEFLKSPIDLQKFKSDKKRNVTTTVTNGMNYYFSPKFKDSIFYKYNFITEKEGGKIGINKLVVFKYGESKHKYDDSTEILIELKISNKDVGLKKANLVGTTKKDIESKFGKDYLVFEKGIVYSHKDKVLMIEFNDSIVNSFKYIRLNTNVIDDELIRKIKESN